MSEPYADRESLGQGIEALGGILGAFRRKKALTDYDAMLRAASEYNIYALKKQGDAELKMGAMELQREHAKGRMTLASARADAAARGVAVDAGSAVDLARGIDTANAMNENAVMQNAYARARQSYDAPLEERAQQELSRMRIEQQQEEETGRMFSSFLGGIGSYGSVYSQFTGLLGFGG